MQTYSQKNTFDLIVSTTRWTKKKNETEDGRREFTFGCQTQLEREKWISYIEYLRTKAVYDKYTQKFTNVQFPLKHEDVVEEDDDRDLQFGNQAFDIKNTLKFGVNKFPNNHLQVNQQPTYNANQSVISNNRYSNLNQASGLSRKSIQYQNELGLQKQGTVTPLSTEDLAVRIKLLYNFSMVAF